jgi:diguanylate cyclase (GGDEF)-like protein
LMLNRLSTDFNSSMGEVCAGVNLPFLATPENFMKSSWKHIYPWIKTAVLNLDSVDHFLCQVVEEMATVFDVECLLWVGMEQGSADALRVYGTPEAVYKCAANLGFASSFSTAEEDDWGSNRRISNKRSAQTFHPRSLPTWLLDQQNLPQLKQLESGDLVVPVTNRGAFPEAEPRGISSVTNPLQFVLQLSRSFAALPIADVVSPAAPQPAANASFHPSPATPIRGWTAQELESIEVLCSQVGLAYSALYWRQRLEQSRQQAALIARISRLLNSTLNPDEIVGRIVAELGYGLQCDRSILVNLSQEPVNILAVWDHPDRQLSPITDRQVNQGDWQNVIEMFMNGGASYLQIGSQEPEPDPLQAWLEAMGVLSVLLVPLFIQEEFFGAVALLSYQRDRVYLLDELQTVRQVADQAAIALTNAQHYQSLWHKKEVLLRQNSTLQQEILRDELTQLMNRRSLERELEQLSTKAVWTIQTAFSMIVCDIDYFKLVNDAHGHLIGDEVLYSLAQRLQSQLRRGTPAYRYGGEEFVVILTETDLDKAIDVAERLRLTIRNTPFQTKIGAIEVTASFGVAQQDIANDQSAWDVLQRADRALYEAKRQGRDRVQAIALSLPSGLRTED